MATTKTRTSLWNAQTLTAGAGNTSTAWQDVSTGYGVQVSIILTNGATGPNIAAQVQIETANDYNAGSPNEPTYYGGALVGSTANNGVARWSVELPIGVASFRLTAGSNTGQAVTVDADYANVTAI